MLTNFPNGITSFGMPVLPGVSMPFTGNVYFVNPVYGADGNDGKAPGAGRAFASLYRAHGECTSGNNDVVFLVGNGKLAGSAVLSLDLAIAETTRTGSTAATAGTLNWTKHATHLIGISSGNGPASRAHITTSYGTTSVAYTAATFGSKNFVIVTGEGCLFQNFSIIDEFSTGGTAEILWYDKGQRNSYVNIHFQGMGNAAAAADADSRTVKIGYGGNGEHTFYNCMFGVDTVTRSAANAQIEFAAGTPRNRFIDCMVLSYASASTPLAVLGTGNSCVDRFQLFKNCVFTSGVGSGGTAPAVIMSVTTNAPGGIFIIHNCMFVGDTSTNWGDTYALAVQYVHGAFAAATTGLGINPT